MSLNALKHGHAGVVNGKKCSREYNSWRAAKARCLNTTNENYAYYGGRGITICERWLKFDNFLLDMGRCPDGYSLDRIDNSRGYEPSNCRWASKAQQMNNTRATTYLTINGRTDTTASWAAAHNISLRVVRRRLDLGWSPEDAIKPLFFKRVKT